MQSNLDHIPVKYDIKWFTVIFMSYFYRKYVDLDNMLKKPANCDEKNRFQRGKIHQNIDKKCSQHQRIRHMKSKMAFIQALFE